MEHRHSIDRFLASVANRLQRRAAYVGVLYLVAILGGLALLSPLLAYWAKLDVRSAWVPGAIAAISFILCFLFAFLAPRKRWGQSTAQARFVGEQCRGTEDALGSDLLSSVEFLDASASSGSPELREALLISTAERIAPLRPETLVPLSPLRPPLFVVALIGLLHLAAAFVAPAALSEGWHNLFRPPVVSPFDGARLTQAPLVGDVDVIVHFPEYTGKTDLHLPSSSGDFEAMVGSTVEISTHPITQAESASILLSKTPELISDEEVPLTRNSSDLTGPQVGSFQVMRELFYRFELRNASGRQVEARARHITIMRDQNPKVELFAPAEELDVAKLKRLELAYVASDDFGIRSIDLVYTPAGGTAHRQPLEIVQETPLQVTSPKNTQAKYVWDLSVLPLRPGVRIEYHLEVADNDDVLGPNISKSKSYSLRLFSPRERHEDLIGRQQKLAEHMLELLASRLIVTNTDLSAHRIVQRAASEIVVEMGGLVAALNEDELATKKLRKSIASIRDRMNRRVQREHQVLLGLEKRDAAESAIAKSLEASDTKNIAELEEDVLVLGDWLQRQELENLLSISDEVAASRERIEKLFEEYNRTGSQEVLDEIEREFKTLERKLAQMAETSASLPEDVLDRFVNRDALKQQEETSCLGRVRELLDAGKPAEAQEQMAKCNEEMDASAQALENALQSLRSESFSKEEEAYGEMMNDLADLAQDQKDIAKKAEDIYKKYAKAVSQMQKGEGQDAAHAARETLDALRKKVSKIPRTRLTPFTKEEMLLLEKRLEDTETMLKRGELAEALAMAQHAKRSLKTIRAELSFDLDEAWSRQGVTAEKAARMAQPLAQKLVQQLESATPKPTEIMDSDDHKQLERLRRMQKANRSRAKKLLKKSQEQAESMPGKAGKAMEKGLEAAMGHMKQAEKQMRSRDPSGARHQAEEAANRLGEAQKEARGAARQKQELGRQGWRDEPIRIPGAEDYRTPEKFREEILDAMQDESAPSGFSERVKRYYKDIIQ